MSDYIRVRFYANADDYRPVKWPPPGPYWCTGKAINGDVETVYSVVVAYVRDETQIKEFWPEASEIEVYGPQDIEFSGRFPKPKWWTEPTHPAQNTETK